MTKLTFRAFERIKRRNDILRVRRFGKKRGGHFLYIWAQKRSEDPPRVIRIAILLSRKHGSAVKRNLFKRRIREIFRLNKTQFKRGWDIIVTPKGFHEKFPAPYEDLCKDFLSIIKELKINCL